MLVVNASPLILLARLSRLELLRETRPNREIVVPKAVFDEVMRGDPDDHAILLLPEAVADWLIVIPPNPINHMIDTRGLDPGEIAVLSAALHDQESEVVLDDKAARREASRLGIRCIGTVGLILDAHRLGFVTSVREVLENLRQSGMYISDELFRIALEQIVE